LYQKKDLVVFWGSQSGTAERLANRLVRDCRSRFGLDALAADLADYNPESISNIPINKFAIFILSTYGEGDPSDNATHFLSWLGSNKSTRLPNLRYAAFGLGNKKYKFYNRVVDVVTQAIDQFGAIQLMSTGKADDSEGTTDEDFIIWKHRLFRFFITNLALNERPDQYEPSLQVVEDTSLGLIDLNQGEPVASRVTKKGLATMSSIQALPIKVVKKLYSSIDRSCLHLELDINVFPELKYKTGDHLAVWPSNPNSEIHRLIETLGLRESVDTPLLIRSLDSSMKVNVPSPTTWGALLRYYLEICAPVPRETVLTLAQFATSNSARETLTCLGKDKDMYQEYCSKTYVTLGRLLESTSSSNTSWSHLPLSFLLESLPVLKPRYYSISSSSIISPKQISITVATSSGDKTLSAPGVATGYLLDIEQFRQTGHSSNLNHDISGPTNELQHGENLYAHVQTSKFRLPTIPKTPIIMIACGSGIAPFRGFLAERARIAVIGREVGKTVLFFGCRSEEDYLYKDELQELESSNEEIEIIPAFSRASKKREYVQDRVEEREEEVFRLLLEHNAYLYICGSASMARDVAARLSNCLKNRLRWDENQVKEWSENMRKSHRWQEDVWG
jgi:NADPH-ferrihemoprotein reductase